jgi:hypothetical protein
VEPLARRMRDCRGARSIRSYRFRLARSVCAGECSAAPLDAAATPVARQPSTLVRRGFAWRPDPTAPRSRAAPFEPSSPPPVAVTDRRAVVLGAISASCSPPPASTSRSSPFDHVDLDPDRGALRGVLPHLGRSHPEVYRQTTGSAGDPSPPASSSRCQPSCCWATT